MDDDDLPISPPATETLAASAMSMQVDWKYSNIFLMRTVLFDPRRVRIPEIMMQQEPALYMCVCVCVYIYGQLLLISISSKLAACTHIPGLNDERKLSVQSWGLWEFLGVAS